MFYISLVIWAINPIKLHNYNANEKKTNLDNIDLNRELTKVIEFHEAMAEEKNILITKNVSGKISTDKDLFHNAVSNVLTNAIKYSPHNTQISINTQSTADSIIVSVTDQGPGIPHTEISNVTSRFYRLSNHYAATTSGLGLGLSIVKSIMTSLGGSIDIKPNKPRGVIISLSFRSTIGAQ